MSANMLLLANQWRLCRIQLINWGTFDGYHDLPICAHDGEGAASVVCITGKSGTGKSTLFDAGTVLMMPYGRTLNAASNLARGGSPRAVRTYVKGMLDTVTDNHGRTKGKYLRDDSTLIWSAIVHTWEDTSGALFSAAHFFQLKPGGVENDLDHTFVTTPGHLNPLSLQPYATGRFRARDVRAVYPDCTVYDGSGRFFQAIYSTLGIGEAGNGSNAMKLLYRIQSGIPMTNVDDLFKELVLDPPSTFELAQSAIDCYDNAQTVWVKIDEARRKRIMLEGIDELHARMQEALQQDRLVSSLAHTAQDGPFRLWLERHRLQMAQDELVSQKASLSRTRDEHVRKVEDKQRLNAELLQIQQSIFEHGGGALQKLHADLAESRAREATVGRRRANLKQTLNAAGKDLPESREDWNELLDWSDDRSVNAPRERAQLQDEIDELGAKLINARDRIASIQRDLDYYREHRTCITQPMARARDLMAQAAGLDPTDIPFAAELMDVPREQELWRTAVNISLVHIADRILVDKDIERAFRRAIDGLGAELGRRYHFDFVDLDKDYPATPRAGHVSSKVVYREDSPFVPYVRSLVCSSTDHLCVDTVGQLMGGGARITPSGQERVGNRGAIGHSKSTLIIGFANDMLIADSEAELEDARREAQELGRTRSTATRRRDGLDAELRASREISSLMWDELDARGIAERIAQILADLDRLEHDDELQALHCMREQKQEEADRVTAACDRLQHVIDDLEGSTKALALLIEQTRVFVHGIEQTGIVVTDAQERLARSSVAQTEATLADRATIVRSFDQVAARARTYLTELQQSQRDLADQQRQRLELSFKNYHATFMPDDTEHGVDLEEYPYYHAILVDLVQQRLDEPESEWEASMLRDVAQHLSQLQNGFEVEERAIGERLNPVNQILGQFAFGERRSHLSVVAERRTLSDVRQFRRRLRRLTALSTAYDFEGGEEEIRREHRALGKFVDLLRQDLATTGKNARHYLDTRHGVHIVAHETPANDQESTGEVVVYDSINGKSGGQYQELVAFILGAALLYCLGYNSATMPSYAPVYLDEAFIKADSEHTRRALGALSGLGFQVVIAVPDGKVEAVAPLASQILSLTKDPRTGITQTHSILRDWRARATDGENGIYGLQDARWLD